MLIPHLHRSTVVDKNARSWEGKEYFCSALLLPLLPHLSQQDPSHTFLVYFGFPFTHREPAVTKPDKIRGFDLSSSRTRLRISSYSQEAAMKNNLRVVQLTNLQLADKQSLTPAQSIQWTELWLFSVGCELSS